MIKLETARCVVRASAGRRSIREMSVNQRLGEPAPPRGARADQDWVFGPGNFHGGEPAAVAQFILSRKVPQAHKREPAGNGFAGRADGTTWTAIHLPGRNIPRMYDQRPPSGIRTNGRELGCRRGRKTGYSNSQIREIVRWSAWIVRQSASPIACTRATIRPRTYRCGLWTWGRVGPLFTPRPSTKICPKGTNNRSVSSSG